MQHSYLFLFTTPKVIHGKGLSELLEGGKSDEISMFEGKRSTVF